MMVLLAILLTGIGTYALRAVFVVTLSRQQFPVLALRALEYVAPAVMGALVISMLTSSEGQVALGMAEFTGLAAAAWVAARTRNHIYALIAALGAYWLVGYLGFYVVAQCR